MLSILIPVYKYDIVNFVQTLHQSALNAAIPFEIRVYDDASGPEWYSLNKEVSNLEGVIYKSFDKNLGRSAMRNTLAKDSRFNNLLFIDGDSGIVDLTYIPALVKIMDGQQVIVGKTLYRNSPPEDQNKYLRWLFGHKRESSSAKQRQLKPYHSFKTHHFLVGQELFLSIGFDEDLKEYGHEDTLFGFELQKRNIPILHTDIALYHEGLETADVFLHKTDKAIKNLLLINKNGMVLDTKLWRSFKKLLKIPGIKLLKPLIRLLNHLCSSKLRSSKPNLFSLDLYKLSKLFIFHTEIRK